MARGERRLLWCDLAATCGAGCTGRPPLVDDFLFNVMLTEMDTLHCDLSGLQKAVQKPPVYFLENSWPRQKLRMAIVDTHGKSEALLLSLIRVACDV